MTVQVHRVELEKKMFEAMPEKERVLLFLFGHVSNELNVFNKALLSAVQTGSEMKESVEAFVHASQCLIILRDFIGKLHEARVMYQARVMGDKGIRQKLNARLRKEALSAETRLNVLMDSGVLARVRNKFSFHYGDKGNNLEAAFQAIPSSEPWLALLSRTNGNTFFHYAEMVVQTGILREVDHQREDEPFGKWLHRTFQDLTATSISAGTDTMFLFMEIMSVLTEDYFSEVKHSVENVVATPLKDIRLTFFTER